MSESYYLGMWVHVINVHWGNERFLSSDEYDTEQTDFSELDYNLIDMGGEWVWVTDHDTSYGGMFVPDRKVWNAYPPMRQNKIPYNGTIKTLIYPYGANGEQPITYDANYAISDVSKLGDGQYIGMPLHLLRTKSGFIGGADSQGKGLTEPFFNPVIYIAKGAVRIEGEETTSEDIYQYKDWDAPKLVVADVTVSILGSNPTPIYMFDGYETMLAYNGKGDCPSDKPLTYTPMFNISGILLSFGAAACIEQPVYSSSTDLVITAMTIRKQEVTPHDYT